MSKPKTPTFKLGDFTSVKSLLKNEQSRPTGITDPFAALNTSASGAANTISTLRDTVKAGKELLPSRYHDAYVTVLSEAIDQAVKALRTGGAASVFGLGLSAKRKKAILDQLKEIFQSLAAPIVQLKDGNREKELKAYLALASNLYQRFLQDQVLKRQNAGSETWPELDPLGFFLLGEDGPYTLSPSRELPLSLVAKPAGQLHTAALWVIDGHEVGGHGIHSIVSGFDTEIADLLAKSVKQASGGLKNLPARVKKVAHNLLLIGGDSTPAEFEMQDFLAHIFRTYSQELAADLAGLLNFGPMFANGLMLYFGVHHKEGSLHNSGRLLGRDRLDGHPPDVLRALIAIECVARLKTSSAKADSQALSARLLSACGGALPQDLVFLDESKAQGVTLPLSLFQPLVPTIVDTLMSGKLHCLGDRSLPEVLTWTQRDQNIADKLATTINATAFSADGEEDVEARHLVSAALMALETASQGANFSRVAARIQSNCIASLKVFYLEQCLLCDIPTYSKSRRTENSLRAKTLDSLEAFESMAGKIRSSRLRMKRPSGH